MQVRDLIAELQRFNQFDEVAIDTESCQGHLSIESVQKTLYDSEFADGNRVYVSLIPGDCFPPTDYNDAFDQIDRLQSRVKRLEKELAESKIKK